MRFRCERQKLLEAFQVVGGVVSGRAIKQIYESVKVVSHDGGLELLATDLEVAIRYAVADVEVLEPGALTIPAVRMTGILREIREEQIEVSWVDGATHVTAGGSQFKVLGENPDEFPQIPGMGTDRTFTIPRTVFGELYERTSFAAAKERTRYALNGILVLLAGTKVVCVTTDGRRLAMAEGEAGNPDGLVIEAIVPAKGMALMIRSLSEHDDVLEMRIDESQAMARTGRAVVASRLVEGAFPNWGEVVPVNCAYELDLGREETIGALRKAKLLTNQESRSVRMQFQEGKMVIASRALEVGEARVELAIPYEGPELEIGFNPDYLLEALHVVRAEKFRLGLNGPTSPGKITDGECFTYVVMPVSLE